MLGVVNDPRGTGTAAQIPGVQVAGKTGTAETAPGENPHAWFIAFAPADHPRYAVAVHRRARRRRRRQRRGDGRPGRRADREASAAGVARARRSRASQCGSGQPVECDEWRIGCSQQ